MHSAVRIPLHPLLTQIQSGVPLCRQKKARLDWPEESHQQRRLVELQAVLKPYALQITPCMTH